MENLHYICSMIELAQHIEALLLENDCVMVPGLGGFVAHYMPSTKQAEENIFFPPTRVIGFNPKLKMNDGLLAQSYMSVYSTSFADASRRVEKQVKEVTTLLHEEGKADLPNVGELRCSIHNEFEFIPYDNRITTPYLYGLDSFEMQELAAVKEEAPVIADTLPAVASEPEIETGAESETDTGQKHRLKLHPAYLASAAAAVAAIIVLFFFSAPIENTEVLEGNYAQLMPEQLFAKIAKQSLVLTPVVVRQPKAASPKAAAAVAAKEAGKEEASIAGTTSAGIEKAPETAAAPAADTPLRYHIIVASMGSEKDAYDMAEQLNKQGHTHAKAIIGDGKMRVCIESYATSEEAYRAVKKMHESDTYQDAWVLKKKL